MTFRVTGRLAAQAFANEAGGHRWQRVPENEKHGRVHTSTVTVAVLNEARRVDVQLPDSDLQWKYTGSSGSGGQNVQKNDTAVILTHLPTGETVRFETKSRHRNRQLALDVLRARLGAREQTRLTSARNSVRSDQLGSGMRGDKRRTVALQRGQVTGKRMPSRKYLRGFIEDLA